MSRTRLSTSTLLREEIVPWLAATGPLAYSPNKPPDRDYYFQYSWVIPGILGPKVGRRRQFWFGGTLKGNHHVQLLLAFWDRARRGDITELFLTNGKLVASDVTAPIGAYRHKSSYSFEPDSLILIQHGSYLIVNVNSQPEIESGMVFLYRGIQKAKLFRVYRIKKILNRHAIMKIHAETLIDSVLSFNAVHCNISRSETCSLNDRSWMLGELALNAGLDSKDKAIDSILYSGYALESCYGIRKFGPNYVKFKTPANNIRITTFVCGETEVKVIDPNKLDIIEAVGCKVKEIEV